jgi:DNA-directed RNA polymerase subunit L
MSLFADSEYKQNTQSTGTSTHKYIRNFEEVDVNGTKLKIAFDLHHSSLHFANTLRRMLSARVPTIAFDDTWNNDAELRSIVIDKNTSGIHNEFLSHRLALVPIRMNHSNLAIQTKFNKTTGKRTMDFTYPTDIPTFRLVCKNNIKAKNRLDANGILHVTTADFEVEYRERSGEKSAERRVQNPLEYFTIDPYVNDVDGYIPINKLKRNLVQEDDGEELNITCRPTIGVGYQNARYDPAGNVAFRYKLDDDSTIENIFELKLEYMNQERIKKGLSKFTKEEEVQLRRSFDLLDKERVYKKNSDGTPSIFQYTIESIGFMNPLQILNSALYMLRLQLCDLRHSIELTFRNNVPDAIFSPKLSMFSSPNQENSWVIRIHDEDHTLGNLIGMEMRRVFQDKHGLLQYSAYKMEHPLIHNVDVVMLPKLSRSEHIQHMTSQYVGKKTFSGLQWNRTFLEQLPDEDLYKLVCVCYFLSTISMLVEQTNSIIADVSGLSNEKLSGAIFTNTDGDEYFEKHSDM